MDAVNHYRIIMNPNAGTRRSAKRKQRILEVLESKLAGQNVEICRTEGPCHATQLAAEAAAMGTQTVVAVGGDGTINEVGKGLKGTQSQLGIIPDGSGNGFARHFRIPLKMEKAADVLISGTSISIDTLTLNDHFFMNLAGTGFDAEVAHHFAQMATRGLKTYIRSSFHCFRSFRGISCELECNGERIEETFFLVSYANASEYGNGAKIAPQAKPDDGEFEVCMLKRFPWYAIPGIAWRMFRGNLDASTFISYIRTNRLKVHFNAPQLIHLDGEPKAAVQDLQISIYPSSLKLIVPH